MHHEYQEQYLSADKYNHELQYILWFFVFIFFLISNIALSLIAYLSANNEWDIAKYYSNSSIDFAINTFPFPLLLIVLSGLLFTIIIFKFTNIGKSFSLYRAVMLISFSLIFFSLLFFYAGITKTIHSSLKTYSMYELILKNRNEIWQNPDFGLLSGEIGSITDLDDFLLIDFNNKVWTIKSNSPEINDTSIMQPGNTIKILGRKKDNQTFEAKEIRAYK